ncbi:MAG: ABC transporter ATP-binding protein, partial [Desulfobulbaceae bacterium]|nr:ABC transporter ATP-binding protein [Desulfobulbaceae bacterium]
LSVGKQIADTIKDHGIRLSSSSLQLKIENLLESVGLRHETARAYPCQLSGGMKQRVCIALGIVLTPEIVVADEPTSALDVINQKQIMMTLGAIQREKGLSVVLIGHDLGLLAQFVDRIMVLSAGQIVELCTLRDFLENPLHPYSKALMASLPSLDKSKLSGIAGRAPSLFSLPEGCAFQARCLERSVQCAQHLPVLYEHANGRAVACHRRQ